MLPSDLIYQLRPWPSSDAFVVSLSAVEAAVWLSPLSLAFSSCFMSVSLLVTHFLVNACSESIKCVWNSDRAVNPNNLSNKTWVSTLVPEVFLNFSPTCTRHFAARFRGDKLRKTSGTRVPLGGDSREAYTCVRRTPLRGVHLSWTCLNFNKWRLHRCKILRSLL